MGKSTNDNKKKALAIGLLGVSAVGIVGFSVAYFSDVINVKGKAQMGTIDLVGDMTFRHVDMAGEEVLAPYAFDNFNPGDCLIMEGSIANQGSKSAWFTPEITINIDDGRNPLTVNDYTPALNPLDYITLSGTKLSTPDPLLSALGNAFNINSSYAKPVHTITMLQKTPSIINGGSGEDWDEDDGGIDGIDLSSGDFKLCLDPSAPNYFQDRKVDFNIDFKAVQYRNNTDPTLVDWTNVETMKLN